MSKRTLIFSVPVILAVVLGGVAWVMKERSEKIALEKVRQEEIAKQAALDADFAKYNKTLARHKVTGVKDIEGPYKEVTISNGAVTFSFEVPDKWLTETRNSGEVTMNEEELREFLGTNYDGDIRGGYSCKEVPTIDCRGSDDCSNGIPGTQRLCGEPTGDYWDFTWGMLKDMPYSEMKNYYDKKRDEFSPGFPNATVSSGMKNAIWYTDTGWDQASFYVVSKQDGIRYLENDKKSLEKHLRNQKPELRGKIETKWGNQFVDGRKALVALYPMDFNDKGEYFVTKGGTGGRKYFIEVNDTSMLILQKEAYVEGEFEDGFKHLIETFKFE